MRKPLRLLPNRAWSLNVTLPVPPAVAVPLNVAVGARSLTVSVVEGEVRYPAATWDVGYRASDGRVGERCLRRPTPSMWCRGCRRSPAIHQVRVKVAVEVPLPLETKLALGSLL